MGLSSFHVRIKHVLEDRKMDQVVSEIYRRHPGMDSEFLFGKTLEEIESGTFSFPESQSKSRFMKKWLGEHIKPREFGIEAMTERSGMLGWPAERIAPLFAKMVLDDLAHDLYPLGHAPEIVVPLGSPVATAKALSVFLDRLPDVHDQILSSLFELNPLHEEWGSPEIPRSFIPWVSSNKMTIIGLSEIVSQVSDAPRLKFTLDDFATFSSYLESNGRLASIVEESKGNDWVVDLFQPGRSVANKYVAHLSLDAIKNIFLHHSDASTVIAQKVETDEVVRSKVFKLFSDNNVADFVVYVGALRANALADIAREIFKSPDGNLKEKFIRDIEQGEVSLDGSAYSTYVRDDVSYETFTKHVKCRALEIHSLPWTDGAMLEDENFLVSFIQAGNQPFYDDDLCDTTKVLVQAIGDRVWDLYDKHGLYQTVPVRLGRELAEQVGVLSHGSEITRIALNACISMGNWPLEEKVLDALPLEARRDCMKYLASLNAIPSPVFSKSPYAKEYLAVVESLSQGQSVSWLKSIITDEELQTRTANNIAMVLVGNLSPEERIPYLALLLASVGMNVTNKRSHLEIIDSLIRHDAFEGYPLHKTWAAVTLRELSKSAPISTLDLLEKIGMSDTISSFHLTKDSDEDVGLLLALIQSDLCKQERENSPAEYSPVAEFQIGL